VTVYKSADNKNLKTISIRLSRTSQGKFPPVLGKCVDRSQRAVPARSMSSHRSLLPRGQTVYCTVHLFYLGKAWIDSWVGEKRTRLGHVLLLCSRDRLFIRRQNPTHTTIIVQWSNLTLGNRKTVWYTWAPRSISVWSRAIYMRYQSVVLKYCGRGKSVGRGGGGERHSGVRRPG
jgi:hypothetical protein